MDLIERAFPTVIRLVIEPARRRRFTLIIGSVEAARRKPVRVTARLGGKRTTEQTKSVTHSLIYLLAAD